MHELSIALALLDAALDAARKHEGALAAVHLRLGVLSGVDEAALRFAYGLAAAETAAAGSRLMIVSVPVRAWCPGCQEDSAPVAGNCLICAVCNTPLGEVRQGRELELAAVELGPATAMAAPP